MEHLAEFAPMVQILDAPVPQMGGDVTDTLQILHFPIAEQVIDVPKISCSPCPSRSLVPEPKQRNSWWKCRTCCLPPASPCGSRSRSSTLQFLVVVIVVVFKVLSQDRVQQRLVWQNVDIPVRGGLRGFLPGQSSAQRTVEQLVDSSSGGLQNFHLGQGSAASSSGREDEGFSGGFRTFPRPQKSAKVREHSRSELAAHSSSSTPGAYGVVSSLEEPVQEEKEEHQDAQEEEEENEVPVLESAVWVQFRNPTGKTY